MRTVLAQSVDHDRMLRGATTAALAVVIVVGSAILWIGIPVLGLWLAGEFASDAQGFLFATLGGIPLAMVAFGWVLYRVNDVYERGRVGRGAPAHSAWLVSSTDERAQSRRARAPRRLIDVAMTASVSLALMILAVWFFFYSKMWLVNPP